MRVKPGIIWRALTVEVALIMLATMAGASPTGVIHHPGYHATGQHAQVTYPTTAFQKIGQTAHWTDYVNIRVELDIHSALYNTRRLVYVLKDYYKKQNKGTGNAGSNYRQSRQFNIAKAESIVTRLERLEALKNEASALKPRRQKRFILTLIIMTTIAAAVAGSAYIIYKNSELSKMKDNQNTLTAASLANLRGTQKLAGRQTTLIAVINGIVREGKKLNQRVEKENWDLHALDVADKFASQLERGVEAAFAHRLSVQMAGELNFPRIAEHLAEYCKKNRVTPLIKFYADFLTIEVNTIATEKGFDLYLTVPVIQERTEMDLYRHVNVPMQIEGGAHLTISSQYEYIAVNAAEKNGAREVTAFSPMTQNDLNSCRKLGDFYACDRGNVAHRVTDNMQVTRKNPEVCIWALFAQKYEIARATCDKNIVMSRSGVRMLSPDKFLVYNDKTHRATVQCRNFTRATYFTAGPLATVTLPKGCIATTDTHMFASSDSGFIRDEEDWAVTYKWDQTVKQLTNDLDWDEYSKLQKDVDGLFYNSTKIDLSDAIRAVKTMQREAASVSWWTEHFSGVTGAVTLLLIAASIYGLYYLCRQRRTNKSRDTVIWERGATTLTTISAPAPAPPPPSEHFRMEPTAPYGVKGSQFIF